MSKTIEISADYAPLIVRLLSAHAAMNRGLIKRERIDVTTLPGKKYLADAMISDAAVITIEARMKAEPIKLTVDDLIHGRPDIGLDSHEQMIAKFAYLIGGAEADSIYLSSDDQQRLGALLRSTPLIDLTDSVAEVMQDNGVPEHEALRAARSLVNQATPAITKLREGFGS